MSLGRRLRRALKLEAPPPPYPGRWHDRHSLERLLATPNLELERAGRCSCGAGPQLGAVRCLEDADGGPFCRACAELCTG